jgi:para-nitrobenzyl esterase
MKQRVLSMMCALAVGVAPAAFAQSPAPPETEPALAQSALKTISVPSGAKLTVTSPAFKNGADIPFENTQFRGNVFPGLEWTPGPAGTKSYVVIMQDTELLMRGNPILHWTMFNVTGTKLEAGMTAAPAGASPGPNMRGASQPYMGPRPPAGPKHHYHLQVFAIDTTLPAEAGASYEALTAAMKGHVLAAGEIVGLAEADPNAPAGPGRRGGGPGRAQ